MSHSYIFFLHVYKYYKNQIYLAFIQSVAFWNISDSWTNLVLHQYLGKFRNLQLISFIFRISLTMGWFLATFFPCLLLYELSFFPLNLFTFLGTYCYSARSKAFYPVLCSDTDVTTFNWVLFFVTLTLVLKR